jgi:hypothetical protein
MSMTPDTGWRKIDSAPKDGTPIMGCVYYPEYPGCEYSPRRIYWASYHPNSRGKECWRDAKICGRKMEAVTHWMPLPPPPNEG